ncbi:MAG: hypothetical protein ACLQG3_13660 [Terracidiphilus sp.]
MAASCVAAAALAAGAGRIGGHAQASPAALAPDSAAAKTVQASTAAQPNPPQAGNPAANARRQQLAGECADLLKLATDLKTAVDQSTADQLSVTVVRKAGEIEQLARKVKAGNGKN